MPAGRAGPDDMVANISEKPVTNLPSLNLQPIPPETTKFILESTATQLATPTQHLLWVKYITRASTIMMMEVGRICLVCLTLHPFDARYFRHETPLD